MSIIWSKAIELEKTTVLCLYNEHEHSFILLSSPGLTVVQIRCN